MDAAAAARMFSIGNQYVITNHESSSMHTISSRFHKARPVSCFGASQNGRNATWRAWSDSGGLSSNIAIAAGPPNLKLAVDTGQHADYKSEFARYQQEPRSHVSCRTSSHVVARGRHMHSRLRAGPAANPGKLTIAAYRSTCLPRLSIAVLSCWQIAPWY